MSVKSEEEIIEHAPTTWFFWEFEGRQLRWALFQHNFRQHCGLSICCPFFVKFYKLKRHWWPPESGDKMSQSEANPNINWWWDELVFLHNFNFPSSLAIVLYHFRYRIKLDFKIVFYIFICASSIFFLSWVSQWTKGHSRTAGAFHRVTKYWKDVRPNIWYIYCWQKHDVKCKSNSGTLGTPPS